MKAVVFDLFGTLVPNYPRDRWNAGYARISQVLGLEPDDFVREWVRHFERRMLGAHRESVDQLQAVLESLGVTRDADCLQRAKQMKLKILQESLTPKSDALSCLTTLRSRGLKLALAMDCSWETPGLLDQTPLGAFFSVRAVSAFLGVRKPDPRMYRHVLDGLQVEASECLYVGDGNSEELPGAKRMGMTSVWVNNGDDQHWKERWVPQADHTVHALSEVVALL